MGETTKIIGIAVIVAIVAFVVGSWFQGQKKDREFRPKVESYEHQIDSIRFRLDTALQRIDLAYAQERPVIIRTKYKLIKETQENERKQYFALDTTGRVADFRNRLRARMGYK